MAHQEEFAERHPAARPTTRVDARDPFAQSNFQGLRILLVEDLQSNREVAAGLLTRAGARVDVAVNGAEAVALVAQQSVPFDIVLMDVQMPVLDGLEATRRIRALPGTASLPIVAMTANTTQFDRDNCLDAGMDDHMGKPFALEDLFQCVALWTGRGRAGRERSPAPDGSQGDPARRVAAERMGALVAQRAPHVAAEGAASLMGASPQTLGAVLHTLVGTLGLYGFGEQGVALRQILTELRGGATPESLAPRVQAVASDLADRAADATRAQPER